MRQTALQALAVAVGAGLLLHGGYVLHQRLEHERALTELYDAVLVSAEHRHDARVLESGFGFLELVTNGDDPRVAQVTRHTQEAAVREAVRLVEEGRSQDAAQLLARADAGAGRLNPSWDPPGADAATGTARSREGAIPPQG